MKKSLKTYALVTSLVLGALTQVQAKEVLLDKVAAIVNSGVVLQSEVTDLLASIKLKAKKNGQSLPTDKALRVQVMDKLINDALSNNRNT